jgi:protein-disulfide isomerase-like protein with CxxC motif
MAKKKKAKKDPERGSNGLRIGATFFIDPVCPWGYSASPALRVLEWRYRDQIAWEMVLIGLSSPDGPPIKFTPTELAVLQVPMRNRFGMPFALEPKSRPFTSSRACEAIVAVREVSPGSEWRALRALQLLFFNTPLLPDDDQQIAEALATVPGLAVEQVMEVIDSEPVQVAFRDDKARARSAAGSPAELQGKTADSPEGVRYTAPSIIFTDGSRALEAGGFQSIEAYDVIVANLDPSLKRFDPPVDPAEALGLYPGGLTTQEVAALLSTGIEDPDRATAEQALIGLVGEGSVTRVPLGNDALWLPKGD